MGRDWVGNHQKAVRQSGSQAVKAVRQSGRQTRSHLKATPRFTLPWRRVPVAFGISGTVRRTEPAERAEERRRFS